MTKKQEKTGVIIGLAVTGGIMLLTAASVLAGDLRIQTAGLDVSLKSTAQRGFVVQIDGADCPGAGCPAFALNWSLTRQG